ncbi:MAG: hypothetical protein EBS87_11670 [Sphingomonadaceae bacterium]|nr:hypothetical protein [Sphingomonadaceae bacterium]
MAETTFTGPIKAGNVLQSDGSGVLAGEGGSSGIANVGFAVMAQSQAITQATNGGSAGVFTTDIVIPAGSQILSVTLLVTTAWTGAATTLGIGTTASATALTAAGAVAGGTKGVVSANPGTVDAAIANWRDVGTTDIQVRVTSTNTGNGVGVLTVTYIQSNNLTA